MEATELRIGNLVNTNKPGEGWNIQRPDGYIMVTSIKKDGINHWQDMGASGCNRFENLLGIPLTEDWLVRFGFEWSIRHQSFYKNGFEWVLDFTPDYCFVNRRHRTGFTLADLKYVHQLQNLYYVLTGTELELKD